ncbi:MAG: hypothetical protein ABH885_07390 [Candidatus Omnitrophota bacterium]
MDKTLNGKGEKGQVLVFSLWVLAFLSILAVYSGISVRQHASVISACEFRSDLYGIARSGVFTARNFFNKNTDESGALGVDSLLSHWADSESFFKERAVGNGSFSVMYTCADNILDKKETRYGMIDEERKINVNTASGGVLANILVIVAGLSYEKADELSRAIMDWRDMDDTAELRSGIVTSERAEYAAAGLSHSPRNADFASLEELTLVKGMDTETFCLIRDYITVFSTGSININTVSRQALMALGLSKELTDKFLYYRAGADLLEGTADDNIFLSTDKIMEKLEEFCDLSEAEKKAFAGLIDAGTFDVRSDTFTAKSVSALKGRNMYGTIVCVLTRSGKIRYWGFVLGRENEGA